MVNSEKGSTEHCTKIRIKSRESSLEELQVRGRKEYRHRETAPKFTNRRIERKEILVDSCIRS